MKKHNLFALVLIITSCSRAWAFTVSSNNQLTVRGNNQFSEESREVQEFNSVVSNSIVDVELTDAKHVNTIEIYGDSNILPLVETTVKNHILFIRTKGSFSTKNRLKVKIFSQSIKSVTSGGSGDIEISLNNDSHHNLELYSRGSGDFLLQGHITKLSIFSRGSGDFILAGSCTDLVCHSRGSGDIQGRGRFRAKQAEIVSNGSGDIDLEITKIEKAVSQGSGDLTFSGVKEGHKNVKSKGSGNVNFI